MTQSCSKRKKSDSDSELAKHLYLRKSSLAPHSKWTVAAQLMTPT